MLTGRNEDSDGSVEKRWSWVEVESFRLEVASPPTRLRPADSIVSGYCVRTRQPGSGGAEWSRDLAGTVRPQHFACNDEQRQGHGDRRSGIRACGNAVNGGMDTRA